MLHLLYPFNMPFISVLRLARSGIPIQARQPIQRLQSKTGIGGYEGYHALSPLKERSKPLNELLEENLDNNSTFHLLSIRICRIK